MGQPSLLHQAVAELWPELPALFKDRWPDIDVQLTTLLRALESDSPADAEDALYDLFATSPDALDALKSDRRSIDETSAAIREPEGRRTDTTAAIRRRAGVLRDGSGSESTTRAADVHGRAS